MPEKKMNPEVKALWIEALRSGKYQQGQGGLRKVIGGDEPDQFCCLGVLCDLVPTELGSWFSAEFENYRQFGIDVNTSQSGVLTSEVANWANLSYFDKLIDLNDSKKAPFTKIADYIQENL